MTTRISRKVALKEDINHVLEELWDAEEEEPLYKIFTRECLKTKDIPNVVRFSKADPHEISCRYDDDAVLYIEKYEVGDACMTMHYQCSLIAKGLLPEDM